MLQAGSAGMALWLVGSFFIYLFSGLSMPNCLCLCNCVSLVLCVCAHVYLHSHVCVCVCLYVCVHVHMHACMCVCVCVCVLDVSHVMKKLLNEDLLCVYATGMVHVFG